MAVLTPAIAISIHTLRVEGDASQWPSRHRRLRFQSTPSAWRVTIRPQEHGAGRTISIHTLRVEGDVAALIFERVVQIISIHTLRVEGDNNVAKFDRIAQISIHTLRVEGDVPTAVTPAPTTAFQSTPSAWRVTCRSFSSGVLSPISIHTLRVEGDHDAVNGCLDHVQISIHTLRVEGDSFSSWYCAAGM